MENIKICKVCGLCAGCHYAINTAIDQLKQGNSVTIFKEIVHNNNVNNYLQSLGARFEENIENLKPNNVVIIRAHGEPPQTYKTLKLNNITYKDCTCHNVKEIHNLVEKYSNMGYQIVIIGKHKNNIHPEVFGTMGWAKQPPILIETQEDILKLQNIKNSKIYTICQTTFNMDKADKLISEIKNIAEQNKCELIVNKSICSAQKTINNFSVELAKECDVMIVVGGAKSSNSIELFKNVSNFCPTIFIEDINTYKQELLKNNLKITSLTKVGITAGASTMKSELLKLKQLIKEDFLN